MTKTELNQKVKQYSHSRNGKHQRSRVLSILASIVVFCVTYALILPAITWERTLICDTTEHTHSSSCYEELLISAGTELICEMEEHLHCDNCYTEQTVCICGLEEAAEHSHSEECYQTEAVLTCTKDEHFHDEPCYEVTAEHTEEVLTCTLQEHIHTDACFDAPPAEIDAAFCGKSEHCHAESCFAADGAQLCTMEEHTHSKQCYSNQKADLEAPEDWEASLAELELTGNWATDVLLVAESQLGNKESEKNYLIDEQGTVRGYNRYGAWYGSPYGDWCAMFCSFCLHYAQVDEALFPQDASCPRWVELLREQTLSRFCPAGEYIPAPGDLVFFDFDAYTDESEREANHIGIVCAVTQEAEDTPAQVKTIEGNTASGVSYETYALDEPTILGYGRLPENPERTLRYRGEDYTVEIKLNRDAKLPEGVQLRVRELAQGSEEYSDYYTQMQSSLEVGQFIFCRLFDISFWYEGAEIEPEAAVDVNIIYDNALPAEPSDRYETFHFAEEGMELLDTDHGQNEDGQDVFSFAPDSFSVIGTTAVRGTTHTESGTYYERVTGITPNDNTQYLIVSAEAGLALTYGSSTYSTPVMLNQVKGNPSYYTVSGNVTNQMLFTIRANNVIRSVSNTDYRLKMTGTNIFATGTASQNLTLTRNSVNGTWLIKASNNYYLYSAGTNFTRNTSTSSYNRNVMILRQVNTTLTIPDDVSAGGEGLGGETGMARPKPSYPPYIDPSTEKIGTVENYGEQEGLTMAYASDPATSAIETKFISEGSGTVPLTAVSGTTASRPEENYPSLFDHSTGTKYCVNPSNGTVTVTFRTNGSTFVSGYALTTANDNADYGRLPTGWTLYGSTDNNNWFVLDNVINSNIGEENFKRYYYTMSHSDTVEYFRIVFRADNMIQFSELEVFGMTPQVNDGKILTDKSVIYGGDDYNAFDHYDEGIFGVSLSALGQDYQIKVEDQVRIPVDVVFILDVSGSMGNAAGSVTRREAVVSAVNSAMTEIMNDNPENRAGIVLYSSGGGTLLPLDHYTGQNNQYLRYYNNDIYTANNLRDSAGRTVTSTNGEGNGFEQAHGTYTQYGIALGAQMLENNTDTTYTTTLYTGTEYQKDITVKRQPVIILLSDGDPTHCTSNYMDVLSGPHYGDGVYPSTTNNKGIQGYYTILSANYYKRMVGIHYDTPATFFTIGMGINATGYADMSGASSTGDCYKRAVLNPTAASVADLLSNGARTTNPNGTYTAANTWPISCQMLNQLLGSSYTDKSVSVGNTGSYSQLGSTNTKVPVIPNPYSGAYSYAEDAYFGNLDTAALQKIFGTIISGSLQVKNYGFMLFHATSVQLTDQIGDGMEMKGSPILRYNGINYPLTVQSNVNGVVTYVCNQTASTSDGSGRNDGQRTADLRKVSITVTTIDGIQTVQMRVPEDVLPSYTPEQSSSWYYEQLPIRLIYQVGLTEAAQEEIASLGRGQTKTYYTNAWDSPSVAASSFENPHEDNPYYNDVTYENGFSREHQYHNYMTEKESNPSGTASYNTNSAQVSEGGHLGVKNYLGNNGKLEFTATMGDAPSVTLVKVDGSDHEILSDTAEFTLYADQALTQPIGVYTTDNARITIPELAYGTTYYLKETRAPRFYNIMPEVKEITIDEDGLVVGHENDPYLIFREGNEIHVINDSGYELPETGGIGTLPIYATGLLLLAAAVVCGLILRRKQKALSE